MTQAEKIQLTKELIKRCPRSRRDIKRDLQNTLTLAERHEIEINEAVLLRRKGAIDLTIGCTTGDMLGDDEEESEAA